jgi:hypothetical protein
MMAGEAAKTKGADPRLAAARAQFGDIPLADDAPYKSSFL